MRRSVYWRRAPNRPGLSRRAPRKHSPIVSSSGRRESAAIREEGVGTGHIETRRMLCSNSARFGQRIIKQLRAVEPCWCDLRPEHFESIGIRDADLIRRLLKPMPDRAESAEGRQDAAHDRSVGRGREESGVNRGCIDVESAGMRVPQLRFTPLSGARTLQSGDPSRADRESPAPAWLRCHCS